MIDAESSIIPIASPAARKRPGQAFLAVCATLLIPGLGHWLIGRRWRAVFWLVTTIGVDAVIVVTLLNPRWFVVLIVAVLVACLLTVAMVVDAFLLGKRPRPGPAGTAWRRYGIGVVILGLLGFLSPGMREAQWIKNFVAEAFAIRGRSMNSTLVDGDRVLVRKGVPLSRWDIVVVNHPPQGSQTPLVTRIVGLPGETIEIRDGGVLVDGRYMQPPGESIHYISMDFGSAGSFAGQPGNGCAHNPIRLGRDEYYVLGDNSPRSMDSRLWERPYAGAQRGAVPRAHIVGRVACIYWPPSRWRAFE